MDILGNWHLIHTKPRQERVARDNLQRQGYECFLPLIRSEKLYRGALRVVQEALFPRYLFIKLGAGPGSHSWLPIRSTLGVSRLVTFGQHPAKVDDALIQSLKANTEESAVERRLFESGEKVLIAGGAFAGIEAIYHMTDGETRVMVLLDILSKQVRMAVSPSDLRKAA